MFLIRICPRDIFQLLYGGAMIEYFSIELEDCPVVTYTRFDSGGIGNLIRYFSEHYVFPITFPEEFLCEIASFHVMFIRILELYGNQVTGFENGIQI